MTKTKFGVNPAFYAVLAFILGFFGYTTWLVVLTVFLIAAEQNEWAARQSIQAMAISFIPSIVSALFGLVSFINKIPYLGKVWYWFDYSVDAMLAILVAVIFIIGLFKVAGGKEANLPLVNKFANWAYGKVAPKPAPAAPAQPVQTQAPQQNQPQQPQQ